MNDRFMVNQGFNLNYSFMDQTPSKINEIQPLKSLDSIPKPNDFLDTPGTFDTKKIFSSKSPSFNNIDTYHFSSSSSSCANADDLLKSSLVRFFSKKENFDRFLPIIKRTSPVSLRLLDYFCVNYARCLNVGYILSDKYFEVYPNYRNQLKTFTKKMFDPFKRNTRFTLRYDNEVLDTTIGQLCFFRWCLVNNVLDYVEKNLQAIKDDMNKNGGKDCNMNPMLDEHGTSSPRKRRSSRKKSSFCPQATRVPTPPGFESFIVEFDDL